MMTTKLDELHVSHDRTAQRFDLALDGQTAQLSYRHAPGVISLDHTYVPPPIEGRGVAAKLTRAALDFARAEGLRVVPACSYVATYIRRHPEYQDLVAQTRS
jgi:predicted GNAT family acetyltransferase